MKGAGQMDFLSKLAGEFWKQIKDLYNFYLMLFGMGIGVFCFFVDGNNYKKKGLRKEQFAAKVTGVLYFLFSIILYILAIIF
jgi:hypothetical protein